MTQSHTPTDAITPRRQTLNALMNLHPQIIRKSYKNPNKFMGNITLKLHLIALRNMGETL